MADFDYLAIDTRGQEQRGHVAAADADAARAQLDRRKLFVVRLDPARRRSRRAGRYSASGWAPRR